MKYVSTRGQAPVLSFEEAMLTGLARDGGLYVPETIPTMTPAEIAALSGLSYEDCAFRIMRPYIGDTFTDAEFRDIIAKAYAGFGHTARAAPALFGLGPGHPFGHQPRHARVRIKPRPPGQPRIDDDAHVLDGQRCFGDGGREHDFAASLGGGLNGLTLSLEFHCAEQGQHVRGGGQTIA